MKCTEFKNYLLEIFYKEASEGLILEGHAHLKGCRACRQEWDKLLHLKSLFSTLPEKTPSQLSISKIMAISRSYKPMNLFEKLGFSSWARFSFNLAPALVVVFFIIAGLTLVFNPPFKGSEGGDVASSEVLSEPHLLMHKLTPVSRGSDTDNTIGVSLVDLEKRYQERYTTILEADADKLMMRGRRFKSMGRMDLALRDFETIFRFYPNYTYIADVLMYRAQCYAFLGEIDEAVKSLKLVLKKDPSKGALIQPMIEQLKDSTKSQ